MPAMAQEHVGCGTEHAMQKLYENRPQDQEAAKQPKDKSSKIRSVSLRPPSEKQKKNPNPLKLAKDELPDQIID